MSRPPRDRRDRSDLPEYRPKLALTNLGGPTQVAGDPRISEALAHALDTDDLPRDRLTHGFHSYPARCTVHRGAGAQALELDGATVLDPFCGSGTVLVEAEVRGLEALGIDLNPLAVRIARVKTDPLDRSLRTQLAALGSEVRAASEERVQARDNVRANLPPSELRWYEPHVLKEMAGLLVSIGEVENERLREALTLVFSSLVVKFSRQRSDTSEELFERRIRKGWSRVLRAQDARAVRAARRPRTGPGSGREGAARRAHCCAMRAAGSVDVVFTSRLWGTYDYAAHHARRFAGFASSAGLAERELGHAGAASPRAFARELSSPAFAAAGAASDGWLVLLLGDGSRQERVEADALVEKLADDWAGAVGDRLAGANRLPRRRPEAGHLMVLRPV